MAGKPNTTGSARSKQDSPTKTTPNGPPNPEERPEPGLDEQRHAAAQLAAQRADVLRESYLPSCLATAIGLESKFDGSACRVYLDRFVEDAGGTTDPVERVLLEQLAFAHVRLADLHSQAALAKAAETTKILNNAASRLLGEVRRMAISLREYRGRTPKAQKPHKLRIADVG